MRLSDLNIFRFRCHEITIKDPFIVTESFMKTIGQVWTSQ